MNTKRLATRSAAAEAVYLSRTCIKAPAGSPLHRRYAEIQQALIDEHLRKAEQARRKRNCFLIQREMKKVLEIEPTHRKALLLERMATGRCYPV